MSYFPPDFLTTLRRANVSRCEDVFHPLRDWTPQDWACALAGEVGELCNVIKKLRRFHDGTNTGKDPRNIDEFLEQIADESADVLIYLDLLNAYFDIDIKAAVIRKFNAVSDRMGSDIKLDT